MASAQSEGMLRERVGAWAVGRGCAAWQGAVREAVEIGGAVSAVECGPASDEPGLDRRTEGRTLSDHEGHTTGE